jgi:hypothetical protein
MKGIKGQIVEIKNAEIEKLEVITPFTGRDP